MDVTVSILTLTNTLIEVNSTEFNIAMYYLTIAVSIVGFAVNIFLLIRLRDLPKKANLHKMYPHNSPIKARWLNR